MENDLLQRIYKDFQQKNKIELSEKIHGAVKVVWAENLPIIKHMFDKYREKYTNKLILPVSHSTQFQHSTCKFILLIIIEKDKTL